MSEFWKKIKISLAFQGDKDVANMAKETGLDRERIASAHIRFNMPVRELRERHRNGLTLEILEPIRCVNCRQKRLDGCCERFEHDRMVGLGLIEPGPGVPVNNQNLWAYYLDKMLPCATCAAGNLWLDERLYNVAGDPTCGCNDCKAFVRGWHYKELVGAWNAEQIRIKGNIASKTPEISENKVSAAPGSLAIEALDEDRNKDSASQYFPSTWPGVGVWSQSDDNKGLNYCIEGISRGKYFITMNGFSLKALFRAWLYLYDTVSLNHLESNIGYLNRRSSDNDSDFYGVSSVGFSRVKPDVQPF